ncbi:MAG: TonB-dependent receptor [Planctomycetes bacterium]|nr:TonB-dependent receptor [Planctomycetota bacterium]
MRFVFAVSVVLLLISPGFSQETEPPPGGAPEGGDLIEPAAGESEGDMIVSATRLKRSDLQIPRATGLINERRLWRENPRSVPEALHGQPGVMVQKTAHGAGSPQIRGLIGQQVLLLVDGVRMTNSIFRAGPNQYLNTVDPFVISRIEVVRGPGSVLYGSDALGGTIALFTRRRDVFDDPWDAHLRLKTRAATADESFQFRAETEGNAGSFGWYLGSSLKWFDDLRSGDHVGRQPFTGYDEYDADIHLDLALSEKVVLSYATLVAYLNDVPRSDKLFRGYRGTGSDSNDKFHSRFQRHELHYLKLRAEKLGGWLDAAEITVSADHQSELRHIRKKGSTVLQRDEDSVLSAGLSAVFASKPLEGHTLTYGLDFTNDWINSDTERRDQATQTLAGTPPPRGTFADDSQYRMLGVFVQEEFKPSDWLLLTAGLRGTYVKVDIGELDPVPTDDVALDGLEKTFHDLSWDLHGSVKLPIEITEIRFVAGVSRGFRAPNIDDYSAFQETSSSFDVPNRGIGPERLVQYEAGFKGGDEKWKGSVFGFYSEIRGLITRQDVTFGGSATSTSGKPFKARANSDRAHIYGVEADLEWEVLPHFRPFFTFTYIVGHDDDRDQVIRRMPPTMATYGFRYEEDLWFFEIWGESARTQDRLNADDRTSDRIPAGGTPGWTTANARAGWRPCASFKATLSLENILDVDHRYHDSGVNEAGFNVVLGVDLGF